MQTKNTVIGFAVEWTLYGMKVWTCLDKISHCLVKGSSGPWLCTTPACQQWRQREGLTAFDSWNPGFSRVLTSSECQRYLCKAACKYVKVLQYSAHRFFCLRIDTDQRRKTCSGIRGVMPRSVLPFQSPTLRSYASQSLREDLELLVGWWQRHFFPTEIAVTFFVFSLDSNVPFVSGDVDCDVTKKHLHSHRTEETRVCGRMISAWLLEASGLFTKSQDLFCNPQVILSGCSPPLPHSGSGWKRQDHLHRGLGFCLEQIWSSTRSRSWSIDFSTKLGLFWVNSQMLIERIIIKE